MSVANANLPSIKQFAKIHGISIEELIMFEQIGLITPKTIAGNRFYDTVEHLRVQLILKGLSLGFSMPEIVEILNVKKRVQ